MTKHRHRLSSQKAQAVRNAAVGFHVSPIFGTYTPPAKYLDEQPRELAQDLLVDELVALLVETCGPDGARHLMQALGQVGGNRIVDAVYALAQHEEVIVPEALCTLIERVGIATEEAARSARLQGAAVSQGGTNSHQGLWPVPQPIAGDGSSREG